MNRDDPMDHSPGAGLDVRVGADIVVNCPHDAQMSILRPIMWGVLVGVIQAASPIALRWLEPAVLHALYIAFIAAVYIGFAVADGRTTVIAVEARSPRPS